MLNQNKYLIALFVIGCIVGYVLRLATAPENKSAVLNYAKKDSTYVQRVELPPVRKDSSISIKIEKGKPTKKTNKLTVTDSLGQSASVTVHTTVVDDSVDVRLSLEMLPMKFMQTKMSMVTKTVLEYVEIPWYQNKWFYGFLGAIVLLVLSLTN